MRPNDDLRVQMLSSIAKNMWWKQYERRARKAQSNQIVWKPTFDIVYLIAFDKRLQRWAEYVYGQADICIHTVLLDWLATQGYNCDFVGFMTNKAETAPQTPRLGVESGSSEKQPQPVNRESCISMLTSLGGDAIQQQ